MRSILGLALMLLLGCLGPPVRAADARHDLVGCWDYELTAEDRRQLKFAPPGSIADSTLCLKRNGETTASAVVGGGQIDGQLLEMEGMDGSGRHYLSNGRLVLHGLYGFDSYGPLSCVLTFTSHDRFELTECISGFPDNAKLTSAPSRSYLRQRKS